MAKKKKKIFVLDTSVILYNHNSINSFEDNNIAIPISVLEELDNFKKGNETKNFEAREFIRILDKLSENGVLQDWVQLEGKNKGKLMVVMNEDTKGMFDAVKVFGSEKKDHRILNAALKMQETYLNYKVTMVSKDVNLRLKAKALNLNAEDFQTGKIQNIDELYTGKKLIENLPSEVIVKLYEDGFIEPKDINLENLIPNQYFILKNGRSSALAYYNPITKLIERIEKKNAQRIRPRNAEQVFAMHAIANPDIKLVSLQGVAGTGKTLLALACALEQKKAYKQIFLSRPVVPLSNKDIGYLPGDIKSKLNPYMEPLFDNLKFIRNQYNENDKEYKSFD